MCVYIYMHTSESPADRSCFAPAPPALLFEIPSGSRRFSSTKPSAD